MPSAYPIDELRESHVDAWPPGFLAPGGRAVGIAFERSTHGASSGFASSCARLLWPARTHALSLPRRALWLDGMVRLVLAGAHSRILSTLCAACPHSPSGCCVGPPPLDWSDIGRIVALGGREWLLGEVAAQRLVPFERGLLIRRRKGVARPGGPRMAKCVYHRERGCSIDARHRPATCNYYVCESALAPTENEERADAGPIASSAASRLSQGLAQQFRRWDAVLADAVASTWPEGPPFDAPFLDGLGVLFERLAANPGNDGAELEEA